MGSKLEVATGVIDGANLVFSVSTDYKPGSLVAILNGQSIVGEATELGGKDFELPAECVPRVGDVVAAYYFAP